MLCQPLTHGALGFVRVKPANSTGGDVIVRFAHHSLQDMQ